MVFTPGKLPLNIMQDLLSHFKIKKKGERLTIGPELGQDFAAIEMDSSYLIVKSNPVTFATEEIGYYAVILNANDVALSGAQPKWFSATILLPEKKTNIQLCTKIFQEIASTCEKLDIQVIGGHTEVTLGLDRPIIAGSMIGEISKEKLVTTHGAKPGDALLLTKGIAIEGTAIIALEKEEDLMKKGVNLDLIKNAQKFLHHPGISILSETQILTQNFGIHALHGPTEGGIAMGIVDIARNSKCGVKINANAISIFPETKKLCEIYKINPLNLIASGSLLIACNQNDAGQIISILEKENISVMQIGVFTRQIDEYLITYNDDFFISLEYTSNDEITKIF